MKRTPAQGEASSPTEPSPAPGSIKVLLVEDNAGDARLVEEALQDSVGTHYDVLKVDRLAAAMARLAREEYDAVLLDLSLPDSDGLATYSQLREVAPQVPVVVMTGFDDDASAVQAVAEGADDYLVKGEVSSEHLARVLRYAVQRQLRLASLRRQATIDELTGVHNRRGFLNLARQNLQLAERVGMEVALLFIDLNDLKQINDRLGHPDGDRALVDAATILLRTFRGSDVVGRLGGDEFCVLLTGDGSEAPRAIERLKEETRLHNERVKAPYSLSFCIGAEVYDPQRPRSLETLIEAADQQMYIAKRARSPKP